MATFLSRSGPFTDPDYTPEFGLESLVTSKVLVLGAGGLGCEILKNLVLSGFRHIECIDMDTIETSNLNRQFLFRSSDVGKSKAIVACEFVTRRLARRGLTLVPHFCKIQDFDDDFYSQFSIIVCGLDSIEARRWMNEKLVSLAATAGRIIPWIDGGTEGFQGSVKLMIPTITACFECYMKLVPVQTTYPLCTLASTPRLPEHCIEWAHELEWPKRYPDMDFDADVPEHVDLMYQLAKERASQFGIEGVTKAKTLGVVKNIIPAIASTNAVVAAACCHECFKFVTSCADNMRDSMYYNGETGVVCVSDPYDKAADCAVCASLPQDYVIDERCTLGLFVAGATQKFGLQQPLFFTAEGDLYNSKKPDAFATDIPVVKLIPFADRVAKVQINIVDSSTPSTLKLILKVQ
ncbi:hypothetical protein KL930_000957 [Ogataea haglerorum]|uniref:NEDD8-activating enzyme E1 catalytic subunit n=1 Tax=Ogataea haglerorum TaxID=1937702 RepID=A0ABQ7RNB5_9ASCO|nr:hypothetical protein KL914_000382 [Ogataea haglerorum]KAG7769098.1 hypothetical protein KL946_000381 [Ogataea haglerorum]KAG7781239.1 hypothetical protein KL922_000161 [Ogataea haglerorum]KAG7782495.1 hypothetical protein KL930_000957 [Ogataea haglerorum]